MGKNKKTSDMELAIKALKKIQRDEEIRFYGKTICYQKIEKSKKAYSRKEKHKGKIFEK